MALSKVAVDRILADTTQPNVPAKGKRLPGPVPHVPVPEQRRRREAMSALLANGSSIDVIINAMTSPTNRDGSKGFGLSESAVRHLMAEVRAQWLEEDADAAPARKSAAIRRVYGHIRKSSAKNAWTAVAGFEKLLIDLEGTVEQVATVAPTNIRLTASVALVLGDIDANTLRLMIEQERRQLAPKVDFSDVDVIDVKSE